jgi:Flp pilus assembly protein TadG
MRAHLRRCWTSCNRERGSVSLWMVTAAMAMIILTGLAVDLGGQVLSRQHVANVAAQAARAAASNCRPAAPSAAKAYAPTRPLQQRPPAPTWPPPMSSGQCSFAAAPP